MICRTLMDKVYDLLGEGSLPLLFRLKLEIHLLFCRRCTEEVKKLKKVQQLLQSDFFPDTPEFEDLIMKQVYIEKPELTDLDSDIVIGVSFKSWVITGFIILISLSTSFLSMDFIKIAASQGSSFLLPVGLTIGCIVTSYGAIFIGSHLKELSEWFRIH